MANEKNTENQSAFKELVLPVIVLVAICLLCSALLAVLNDITKIPRRKRWPPMSLSCRRAPRPTT
mgnify:CR=1 FL=1